MKKVYWISILIIVCVILGAAISIQAGIFKGGEDSSNNKWWPIFGNKSKISVPDNNRPSNSVDEEQTVSIQLIKDLIKKVTKKQTNKNKQQNLTIVKPYTPTLRSQGEKIIIPKGLTKKFSLDSLIHSGDIFVSGTSLTNLRNFALYGLQGGGVISLSGTKRGGFISVQLLGPTSSTSPVPIPGTGILVLSGLLGVGLVRRKLKM